MLLVWQTRAASTSPFTVRVTLATATRGHALTSADGFYEPHSWADYDPNNPSATTPAKYLTVDTHQFWAFPPLNNLSEAEILTQICELGTELRTPSSGIPPTLVGEWSLDTGKNTSIQTSIVRLLTNDQALRQTRRQTPPRTKQRGHGSGNCSKRRTPPSRPMEKASRRLAGISGPGKRSTTSTPGPTGKVSLNSTFPPTSAMHQLMCFLYSTPDVSIPPTSTLRRQPWLRRLRWLLQRRVRPVRQLRRSRVLLRLRNRPLAAAFTTVG